MKIICISDTHNEKPTLPPDGDLLIHAGDLTMHGTMPEVEKSLQWLGDLARNKYEQGVILIPGNHDFYFEPDDEPGIRLPVAKFGRNIERNAADARKMCEDLGVNLLIDQSIVVDGVRIYGSPIQPWFHDWAFNRARGEEIANVWAKIPDDTQVLVTHGPALGIGDLCRGGNVGCADLLKRIGQLKDLKLHIFGHIHEGSGDWWNNNKLFINASVLDGFYYGFNDILSVEWSSLKVEKFSNKEI